MAGQKILMVEGKDDEHVLTSICRTHDIPPLDKVIRGSGDEGLLDSIPIQLRLTEEGDVVGVIIDADTNAASRWQSIRNRLVQIGYEYVPARPDPSGTILEPPSESLLPRAGVWIMPDNKTSGSLEDFLRFLVPQSSALFDHAISSVSNIPTRLFSQSNEPKAIIHTWLAWQKEPGLPYGTAITARFLDPDVPQVDLLVSWLKRLFP